MAGQEDRLTVLLATASDKTAQAVAALLPKDRFSLLRTAASAARARQTMMEDAADVVIISPPLPDESGLGLAEDLCRF